VARLLVKHLALEITKATVSGEEINFSLEEDLLEY